ncbi:MAG TPA: ATP-binding protein [Paludibacter sp.]|jgi:NadR type nicotinamide-nucleotide adenylyltransferase
MYKIAIIGPESTGKTALAKSLAVHFKSPWVPEYAREYVEKLTDPYTYDDICNIAVKQIEQESAFEGPQPTDEKYIFFDTDLIITKVWFSYCFQRIPDFLTERLKNSFFDLYLLCAPDLMWEPDPVREHGNDREYFFDWYKNEIEQTGTPYVIVTGTGNQRIQNAIVAIQNQLL